MNIEFDSESVYGDNDKSIKTKIKLYGDRTNIFSRQKNNQKKMLFINNVRLCY